MNIHTTQTINLPIDKVWQVFGHEFADIQNWAGIVKSSKPKLTGGNVGDAKIAGRFCETTIGSLDETLVAFDDNKRELAFTVKSKNFPFFMKGIKSHWQFFDEGGKTRGVSTITLDLMPPFRLLLGWKLKQDFRKAVRSVGSELEAYAKKRNEAA